MKKSKRTIKRNLRELRKLIDTSEDVLLSRIAYAIETAVRWTIEDTTNWEGLCDQAKSEADLLKKQL